MLKVVLLDIDNTLLSFDEYVKDSMRRGFEEFNLGTYKDEMFDMFTKINTGLWHALERGELSFEELKKRRFNDIFSYMGISFDGVVFEKYFRDRLFYNATPENGAMELLQYLKDKYIICAASNGPYEQQVHRLEICGMNQYFSHFFISEEIGSSKPATSFFETCLNRINEKLQEKIKPSEMIIIGDSLTSDMAGGIKFGTKTCYYNRSRKPIPGDIKVDYVVETLSEIENIL